MVSLLDVLARHHDPVSLKQLAQETGLHPSTAHRILNDLVATRFVTAPKPVITIWVCACWNWAILSKAV
jgi:DNA-binding IclR family transcriptional regulator